MLDLVESIGFKHVLAEPLPVLYRERAQQRKGKLETRRDYF
jgi:hypothetical protein